jgi:hypothetical protein
MQKTEVLPVSLYLNSCSFFHEKMQEFHPPIHRWACRPGTRKGQKKKKKTPTQTCGPYVFRGVYVVPVTE